VSLSGEQSFSHWIWIGFESESSEPKLNAALNTLFKQHLVKTLSKIRAGFAHTATSKSQKAKTIPLLGIQSGVWKPEGTFTILAGRHFRDHFFD